MIAIVSLSNRKDKKYSVVVVADGKARTVHFGASGYDDLTVHHDEKRKQLYIKRHGANEDWNDPYKPGFWAKNLLWNKETLEESAKDIEENHDIKVIIDM